VNSVGKVTHSERKNERKKERKKERKREKEQTEILKITKLHASDQLPRCKADTEFADGTLIFDHHFMVEVLMI
jgi:hypothetical protein